MSARRERSARVCRAATVCALASASLALSSEARAGGLYFSDRGVRPMGRAGAFVAGADDLHAIWYNPAGLADAGTSALVDFAWLRFSVEYERELLILDADGTYRSVRSPTVNGNSQFLPLPTMAASYTFGQRHEWTVAAGLIAPYVALNSYAERVGGQPSPARYTLGSFDGSLLAIPGAWIAYKPFEELRLGLGAMALVGVFQSQVTFSASPQDRLIGAPEQPEYDAAAQLRVGPIFSPTLNAGATFVPSKYLRVGVSGQLPTVIDASAKITVRLPTSTVFDTAKVSGDAANVRFVLPGIVRVGVEARPTDSVRVELAYVRELWSAHDAITAVPNGISLDGITGLPPKVAMPTITIPRGFTDSSSLRLGGEARLKVQERPIDLRAGASYESSGVPPEYLSLSSLDFDKVTVSLGAGLHLGERWRLDAVYAHIFASGVRVEPRTAQLGRVNPIKGNAPFEPVNGGTYSASADLFGIGANYSFR